MWYLFLVLVIMALPSLPWVVLVAILRLLLVCYLVHSIPFSFLFHPRSHVFLFLYHFCLFSFQIISLCPHSYTTPKPYHCMICIHIPIPLPNHIIISTFLYHSISYDVGVAAFVSPDMMAGAYSLMKTKPGTPYTWSSKGPTYV